MISYREWERKGQFNANKSEAAWKASKKETIKEVIRALEKWKALDDTIIANRVSGKFDKMLTVEELNRRVFDTQTKPG